MKRGKPKVQIIIRELDREYAGLVEELLPWSYGGMRGGGRRCVWIARRTDLRCRRAAAKGSMVCPSHISMLGVAVYAGDRAILAGDVMSYLMESDAPSTTRPEAGHPGASAQAR